MENNFEQTPKWRSWWHIAMGVMYVFFALLILNLKSFGSIELGNNVTYALSALLAFYGLFRIYRGVQDLKKSR